MLLSRTALRTLLSSLALAFPLLASAATFNVQVFFDTDANGVRTNAVIFGARRTFVSSLVLFTLAQVILFLLALEGILPRPLAILAALYPLQLFWSVETLRAGLTFENVSRLQARYRVLYAVIGVAMIVALRLVR